MTIICFILQIFVVFLTTFCAVVLTNCVTSVSLPTLVIQFISMTLQNKAPLLCTRMELYKYLAVNILCTEVHLNYA